VAQLCFVNQSTYSLQNNTITMNRKLLYVAIAILSSFVFGRANAQNKMEPGNVDIFFRVGTPFLQTSKFNIGPQENFTSKAPAVGLGYELGMFTQGLSAGLEINYATFTNNTTLIDANGTIGHHYGDMTILNFEIFAKYYTPLAFGNIGTYVRADLLPFAIYNSKKTTDYNTGAQTFNNRNGVKMTYGAYAGATYQLAGPLGAFAEIGYGYTAVNAGISLRVSN
jgi:hypothetical protein